jgi:ABC-type uncharacterized transport system involved in gliding motility auxiliary subunit
VTKTPGKYIKFLVYMVIVVLINLVGLTLFFRADLTYNQMYSISTASQEVVSTLSEPLTVNVFFTKNLPAPHNNTERYLRDLLGEYGHFANRFFNYRFYNVSAEEGEIDPETKQNQELAKGYGIFPLQIQVIEQDEVKFQKAYMGMVLIHGDLIERIPTIASVDGLEYRITTSIQKLNNKVSALLKLEDKIQVRLFLSSSMKSVAPYMRLDALSDLPQRFETIVEALNAKTYNRLAFEHVDPSQTPEARAQAEEYKLMNLKWPALADGKVPAGNGIIGLVMEYGPKVVTMPLLRVFNLPLIGTQYQLADLERMEETLSRHMEALIDINTELGVMTGNGSIALTGAGAPQPQLQGAPGAQRNFQQLMSQNYSLREINLSEEDLPANLQTLVIPTPTEPFTEYELFQIDQFLMRGKSLALFLDPFKEVMPQNQQAMQIGGNQVRYIPIKTGLEKLLAHYGVRINPSYVMDENCYRQNVGARLGGGERPIYFAPLIKNQNISKEFKFMQNIKGLVAVRIGAITLDSDKLKQNDLVAHELFSSSADSWEMSGQINLNPMFIRPPSEPEKQKRYPLAYILEGAFPSYFADKPLPSRTVEQDPEQSDTSDDATQASDAVDLSQIERKDSFIAKGQPGKIFLIASSEMIKDNVLGEDGRSPNEMFVMNVIDYLNAREEIAIMRSKEQRFNPLDDTSAGTKLAFKSVNIVGLPVIIVLLGLGIWFRRHGRKKRIQIMFQK